MKDFIILYAPFIVVLIAVIAAFIVATTTKTH